MSTVSNASNGRLGSEYDGALRRQDAAVAVRDRGVAIGDLPGAAFAAQLSRRLAREGRLRQIFTGLRAYYPDPAVLVGRSVAVVVNLKPRQMKFGLSEGMVLAASSADEKAEPGLYILEPHSGAKPGMRVR